MGWSLHFIERTYHWRRHSLFALATGSFPSLISSRYEGARWGNVLILNLQKSFQTECISITHNGVFPSHLWNISEGLTRLGPKITIRKVESCQFLPAQFDPLQFPQYPQDQLIVFHIIALCRLATEPLFISSQRKNCHNGKKIECENEYVEDCNDTRHGYKGFTRRCEGVPLRKVPTSSWQIKILNISSVRQWEEGFQPFYIENAMKCQQKTVRQLRSSKPLGKYYWKLDNKMGKWTHWLLHYHYFSDLNIMGGLDILTKKWGDFLLRFFVG